MKNIKNKVQEYWHAFKIWFCHSEVDFFLKEIERWKFIAEQKDVQLKFTIDTDNKALQSLHDQLQELKLENMSMLSVDPDNIVRVENVIVDEGGVPKKKLVLTVGNEKLTPEMSKILKEEVAYVKRTMWWTLVQATLAETARQNMFEQSKDYCDMHKGKATLYNLRLEKDIMDKIENG